MQKMIYSVLVQVPVHSVSSMCACVRNRCFTPAPDVLDRDCVTVANDAGAPPQSLSESRFHAAPVPCRLRCGRARTPSPLSPLGASGEAPRTKLDPEPHDRLPGRPRHPSHGWADSAPASVRPDRKREKPAPKQTRPTARL